jgi:hypothetical protein
MKESELEKILVDEIRKAGGRTYKWVSPGNSGVPDRIVFFPGGKVYFVELKTDSGKLGAQQKVQIKRLQVLGQDVRVVKGIRGLVDFFYAVDQGAVAAKLMKRYEGGDAGEKDL